MHITFHNLGQINKTELDLRPLTVIIGPNNSNKTYLAYCVYGLCKVLSSNLSGFRISRPVLQQTADSVIIDLDELATEFVRRLQRETHSFSETLSSFFQDSSGKLFRNSRLDVHVTHAQIIKALSSLTSDALKLSIDQLVSRQSDGTAPFAIDINDGTMTVSEKLPADQRRGPFRLSMLADYLPVAIDHFIRQSLFSTPYLLPAERNALIITYKVLANRRLKLMLQNQRNLFSSRHSAERQLQLLRESGEVRYPEPVEDFLEFLTDIELEQASGHGQLDLFEPRPSGRSKRSSRPTLASLATTIEAAIQGSAQTVYSPTALGGMELNLKLRSGQHVDLYNASSSTKQLAPLLLYLRYRANPNDLLIIDEPEMNLHPESQTKLLEIIAMLVNGGVNILLTTHSPYIVAHLNNLVRSDVGTVRVRARQARHLYLEQPSSFLSMDQVSAYEMRDHELISLKDPDFGIRWDTLSDVSVSIQDRFFQIEEDEPRKA